MNSAFIRYPFLNPIRMFASNDANSEFHINQIPFFEARIGYCQKYQTSDTVIIQFAAPKQINGLPVTVSAKIIDTTGATVTSLTITTLALSYSSQFNQYQITKSLSALTEGEYYFQITVTGGIASNRIYQLISESINVKAVHPNTVLLEYSHDTNDFDVIFIPSPDTKPLTFQLRVEGGFKSSGWQPGSKDVVYQNQEEDTVQLESIPFLVRKLCVGDAKGIPNYLADKINRIWSCSNVKKDGQQFVKAEGAKMEAVRSEKYPMAAWLLDIIDIDNEYSYGHGSYTAGGIGVMVLTEDFEVGLGI